MGLRERKGGAKVRNTMGTLDALVTALQQAVNRAGDALRAQQLQTLSGYFDEKNEPLYVKLRLPRFSAISGELEHVEVEVPRLSLVPMGTMQLDEAEMDFTVRLCGLQKGADEIQQMVVDLPGSLTSERDCARIHIKFKGGDPPEAVMKLNDTLLNIIP